MLFKLTDIQQQIANLTAQYDAQNTKIDAQNTEINTQNSEIAELKEKLAQLEEDVSFNAVITDNTVINDDPTVFDVVRHDSAKAYNSTTGEG